METRGIVVQASRRWAAGTARCEFERGDVPIQRLNPGPIRCMWFSTDSRNPAPRSSRSSRPC